MQRVETSFTNAFCLKGCYSGGRVQGRTDRLTKASDSDFIARLCRGGEVGRNSKRLTYGGVSAWLHDKGDENEYSQREEDEGGEKDEGVLEETEEEVIITERPGVSEAPPSMPKPKPRRPSAAKTKRKPARAKGRRKRGAAPKSSKKSSARKRSKPRKKR